MQQLLTRRSVRALSTLVWGNADNNILALPRHLLRPEPHTFGFYVPRPTPIPAFEASSITQAALSTTHAAFLRADGALFTSHNNVPEPHRVDGLPEVAAVACGVGFTLVQTVEGTVCTVDTRHSVPKLLHPLVEGGHKITQIAAGDHFCVALCSEGNLFTWGSNSNGQLGHPRTPPTAMTHALNFFLPTSHDEPTPRLVKALQHVNIAQVYAGKASVVALDAQGRAYAWGCGRHYLLGNQTQQDEYTPIQTFQNLRLKKVAIGLMHSLLLTQSGTVYAIGQNVCGALGLGYDASEHPSDVPEQVLTGATDIAAGSGISAAVTPAALYTWGSCAAGALGNGVSDVDAWAPVVVAPHVRVGTVVIGSGGKSVVAVQSE